MHLPNLQGKRMLSPPAHSSAWRGFPLALAVQLPAQQACGATSLTQSWRVINPEA